MIWAHWNPPPQLMPSFHAAASQRPVDRTALENSRSALSLSERFEGRDVVFFKRTVTFDFFLEEGEGSPGDLGTVPHPVRVQGATLNEVSHECVGFIL